MQHIRGVLTLLTGQEIVLDDTNMIGDPVTESQCVEDQETFMFGQLYAGKLSLTLGMEISRDLVIGGEISLEFSVGDTDEWVPLGVWDVSAAERQSEERLAVTGMDRIDRLNVAMDTDVVGEVKMSLAMRRVTELTGVEFAQDVDDLQELIPDIDLSVRGYGLTYAKTCREEVRMIAQLIGGIAFANRLGQIEFRQFGNYIDTTAGRSYRPVLTIPAPQRFTARLSEYNFRVRSISYTDAYGRCTTNDLGGARAPTSSDLGYSGNRYIWNVSRDNYAEYYMEFLMAIDKAFSSLAWTPGRIEWRGDPTLDLGDMVELTGGVSGESTLTYFLITDMTWRFRGRQTLGSAGAGQSAVSSGASGGSGSTSVSTTINVEQNVTFVELEGFTGEVSAEERAIAEGAFSCRMQTAVFADITVQIAGTVDTTAAAAVHINHIAQTLRPHISLHDGGETVLHFTLPFIADAGTNNIAVVLAGECEVTDIQAYVWGQELTEESPDPTSDGDYTYTVEDGLTTVTGYVGSGLSPKIPTMLGSGRTSVIAGGAFTGTQVQSVYIPDGVSEIE